MLHKPEVPDQQGVRDFLTEGVTGLSAVEMNRVLQNCGYEHQRSISERHVAVLADLMRRGRWNPKSQIDFAVLEGRYILINGYHRAYAQVRSGKSIVWNIALHPVKTEADLRSLYYAFDTNIRARGSRDILKAAEFGDTTGLTGDIADSLYRAVPFLASKFMINPKMRNFLVEKAVDQRLALAAEYAKAAAKYYACLDGLTGGRKKKFLGGAVTAVAVATLRFQSQTAWEFWAGCAANDGLKRGDPRLALFNDMLVRTVRGSSPESFAPAIIAWNAWFEDRELRIIKVTEHFTPAIEGTPFDGKPIKVA